MKLKLNKLKEYVSNLMFPNDIKCVFCGEELNQNSHNSTCEECLQNMPFISNPCMRCGSPMNKNQQGVCLKCKSRNLNFIQAKSVFSYDDKPMMVVHKLKYSGKKYLVDSIVQYLSETYGTWNLVADIVTNVPMFPTKEKERGFNQSFLIAKEFSKIVKVPFAELCAKTVDTPSQTTMNTRERLENVKNSFNLKPEFKSQIKNKTILIVDDIITTGATTSEISKVLLENGAKECFVLSFAHTDIDQMQTEN